MAGFREIVWLSPDGEIESLSPYEARGRIEVETPMLCHARAVARRLDVAPFPAFDLLELFAFAKPATFCVPTPGGLATALGLAAPRNMADSCATLVTVARAGKLSEPRSTVTIGLALTLDTQAESEGAPLLEPTTT